MPAANQELRSHAVLFVGWCLAIRASTYLFAALQRK